MRQKGSRTRRMYNRGWCKEHPKGKNGRKARAGNRLKAKRTRWPALTTSAYTREKEKAKISSSSISASRYL